jgi:hypothetical protein
MLLRSGSRGEALVRGLSYDHVLERIGGIELYIHNRAGTNHEIADIMFVVY